MANNSTGYYSYLEPDTHRDIYRIILLVLALAVVVFAVWAYSVIFSLPGEENLTEQITTNTPVSSSAPKTSNILIPDTNRSGNLEPVNCFDYYKFGSVQVDVNSLPGSVLSGTVAVFSGTIENNNSYPIVDGAVYVKIFKKSQSADMQQNGFNVIDQFFAKKGINLTAKERQSFTFKYNIPAFAQSGDYQVATYFVSQDKLNLFGLSFTDDVVGSSSDFKISGEVSTGVFLNKQNVAVGTSTYLFAAFIPKVSKDTAIPVSFDIKNTTSKTQTVKVMYTLYSWDGLLDSNIIKTKTDFVDVPATGSKRLMYTVTDVAHPVYYLVIKAAYNDTSSILNIRFAREGVDVPRINFASVTKYPLEGKTENAVFACVHNSGLSSSILDNKLIVSVEDSVGNIEHSSVYEGPITGNMMGFKTTFISSVSNGDITVKADLYHEDQLVDSVSMKYNCTSFSTSTCKTNQQGVQSTPSKSIFSIITLIILVILLLIFLVVVMEIVALRNSPNKNKWIVIGGVLIVLILLFAWLRFSVFTAEAAIDVGVTSGPALATYPLGTTANVSFDPNIDLYAYADLGFSVDICNFAPVPTCSRCQIPFDNIFHIKKAYACNSTGQSNGGVVINNQNISVAYGVVIKNVTDLLNPQILSNNATVKVGDKIKIERQSPANNNISWFIAGSTTDSPYGYWDTLPSGCNASDHIASDVWLSTTTSSNMDFYLPVSINYPSMNVVPVSTNLSTQTSDTFVVTVAGPIEISVNFLPTSVTEVLRYTKNGLSCKDFNSYTFSSVIPQKTVSVYLSAVPVQTSNQAPSSPSIISSNTPCGSGPTWTSTVVYSATDPESNNMTYGIMTSDDGGTTWSSETTIPSSGTVTSGSPQTFVKTWTLTGSKKIKIRAIDIFSNSSPSTVVDIVAQTCSVPPALPTVNLSASPISVSVGGTSNLTWSSTNATACTASANMPTGNWNTGQNGNVQTPSLSSDQTYTLTCTGPGGSSPVASASVTVTQPTDITLKGHYVSGEADNLGSQSIKIKVGQKVYLSWASGLSADDYICRGVVDQAVSVPTWTALDKNPYNPTSGFPTTFSSSGTYKLSLDCIAKLSSSGLQPKHSNQITVEARRASIKEI